MKQGDEILDGFPQDVTAQLIAYLSGDLSADQREAFEAQVLEDEFFSQQVEDAQFALLEAYAEGTLPREVRERIATWVASTEYIGQHIVITRSLQRLSSAPRRHGMQRRTLWLIAIAACLFLAVVSSVLVRRPRPAPLVARLEPPRLPTAPVPTDTILLAAQRLRGAGPFVQPPVTYKIHPSLPVRIQVILPSSHSSNHYSVVVKEQTSDKSVARFNGVEVQGSAQSSFVEIILPAHTLQPGIYRADVDAHRDTFDLLFRVVEIK